MSQRSLLHVLSSDFTSPSVPLNSVKSPVNPALQRHCEGTAVPCKEVLLFAGHALHAPTVPRTPKVAKSHCLHTPPIIAYPASHRQSVREVELLADVESAGQAIGVMALAGQYEFAGHVEAEPFWQNEPAGQAWHWKRFDSGGSWHAAVLMANLPSAK